MKITISDYLLTRLKELNVNKAFGIPGDYVLPFFDRLIDGEHGVEHVLSRNELNGTYAADGYAKVNGFGAMAVTFGVGSLSTVNAVAGAYSDDTPLIVICGAPATPVLNTPTDKLYHHVVGNDFDTSLKVFENITIASERIMTAESAPVIIDTMLRKAYQMKKPIYLELPYDIQTTMIDAPTSELDLMLNQSSQHNLNIALDAAKSIIMASKTRSIVTGHQLQREEMIDEGLQLVERLNAAVATTFTCKIGVFEDHPNAVGIYMGKVCEPYTNEMVEGADVAITLGVSNNEFDTGVFSSEIGHEEGKHRITIEQNRVVIDQTVYDNVFLREFLPQLLDSLVDVTKGVLNLEDRRKFAFEHKDKFEATDAALTIDRLFIQFSNYLKPGDLFYADTGGFINSSQAEFPSDIVMHGCGNWGSLGAGFGMFCGAVFTEKADTSRLVTIQGEGAFNMSAQELSNLIEYKKDAVIFILDNSGYGAERAIHPGKQRSYNDIPVWNYEELGVAFGGTKGVDTDGFIVRTEKEMEATLTTLENPKGVNIVRVMLDPWDSASFNIRFSQLLRH
ncbi:thiamine pyrophosphate-dependent enzyme [Vibrio sp. SS-MA-C1-2]|uniref:thiamine pyrophosphate-binding protein n=1 Tax=Vibrio sp. SS-MA-C1-2 TaxID=2908646 RepID=UPI001F1FCA94|nr:thiamine pyrophosphate-binding protein [Vibrio sp. SS-MA-C1-2]UJF18719.1 thiamine pyrophosphate-dependent enzyme [Vibrio sp. SS-MA-C1-2]